MEFLGVLAIVAAAGLILIAAWQDFQAWKIRNWTVLALVADYALLALIRWANPAGAGILAGIDSASPLQGDLAAALLLLTIGFVLWALRMLGAGDAKLFFPIGLFVGLNHLFSFAVGLAAGGVVVSLALQFPVPLQYQAWPALSRIEEIRKSRKVPYGVIMAAAALIAMYLRYFAA
ncbi:pilus assembly protein CpaA [Mesorhizobium sp. B2-3-11]|uniref:pilus assembly protein CpaA n=1 Tax=Mesorhizobium sp. B2-3-11 TaxID=2589953 RepID=UPI0011267F8A|nr:pilus assembly protein CpaA [Mesorhizobium sp. B2-3-11]TPM03768.1 pilus assembly protein CpaA [Mesorhizobium sp. B2-3-11]